MDKDTTVADLKSRVFDFCEERHWNKSHNPKDLSIGISTEANELMDLFRFKSNDQMKEMMKDKKKRERIGEELADTLIFSLRFAQMYAVSYTHLDVYKRQAPQALNPRQQQAVQSIDRAVAVIAGPGTGKTKTLISRILYLLETRKVKPSEITAVTFTNKAAAEMQERLKQQLGKGRSARLIQVGTFHSICLDLLKKQGMQFTLADETETLDIAADIVKSRNLGIKPRQFLQKVSRIKTNSDVFSDLSDDRSEEKAPSDHTPFTALGITESEYAAYIEYCQILRSLHILDFDDLLTETLNLIKSDPTIPAQCFSYLHVDEFQDISPIQYRLIMEWTKPVSYTHLDVYKRQAFIRYYSSKTSGTVVTVEIQMCIRDRILPVVM